jgi:hypothetical protein
MAGDRNHAACDRNCGVPQQRERRKKGEYACRQRRRWRAALAAAQSPSSLSGCRRRKIGVVGVYEQSFLSGVGRLYRLRVFGSFLGVCAACVALLA